MTTNSVSVLRTAAQVRTQVQEWRTAGLSVGLVPTMGALHDGHMALVRAALKKCDRVIASVFVNPTQFGPGEDLNAYPRDEDFDRLRLEDAGAHALFAPSVDEMYPDGHMTEVNVTHFNTVLEGLSRPGHFVGVATVVAKLLNQVQADHAYFGEKDYQQLKVIQRMAKDLCSPTKIHGVPTERDRDGLALSSRNVYLTDAELTLAPTLHKQLTALAKDFRAGVHAARLELEGREKLLEAGFGEVDYLVVVDGETLRPLNSYNSKRPARVMAAVKLGRTRLIDNVGV